MKTLLIITYVDFWIKGSGHRARINSMVNYLKDKINITVFFAGQENENDKNLLKKNLPEIDVEFAGTSAFLTFGKCKEKFEQYMQSKLFDFVLVEYIELSFVLEFLPATTITILDTHDLVYSRIESFKKCNLEYDGILLSMEEELNIFRCYDFIILIQNSDYEKIAKDIQASNLLLLPHPVVLKKKAIRREIRNVGFVASAYLPNIDALKWFINNVWNGICNKFHLILNVYGTVCHGFLKELNLINGNIIFHGFVDDLESVYNGLDIIVNPVRCGAGLKIKNVEALGYGIPLITTTHGASGIEDGVSKAFLLANSPEEYLSAFDLVTKNYKLRKQISNNAFEYAQSNFSEEKCYARLLEIIN